MSSQPDKDYINASFVDVSTHIMIDSIFFSNSLRGFTTENSPQSNFRNSTVVCLFVCLFVFVSFFCFWF